MKLDRQIQRVFGFGRTLEPSPSPPPAEQETTLAYAGYPLLRQTDLFLALPALERWRAGHTLSFPQECCVCSQPAQHSLPVHTSSGWLGFFRREKVLTHVPHCKDHGHGDEAQLLAAVNPWTELVCQISLIGLSELFLSKTRKLNQTGDMPPPWRAFPEYTPGSSGWRQGNGEHWLVHAWSPFWKHLSQLEQGQYLQRWEVPAEWQVWVADFT